MGLQLFLLRPLLLLTVSLTTNAFFPASLFRVLPSLAIKQLLTDNETQLSQLTNPISQRSSVPALTSLSVPTIARLVTVRVLANSGAGSGVIIGYREQTYTVLTNAHVVAEASSNIYTILTADGKSHSGYWLQSAQFNNQDLALIQFSSCQTYKVAAIGNSDTLLVGDLVYASGFPNWRFINSTTLQETRNWGLKAFQLTKGKVGMLPSQPLQQGYQLGYTNQVEPGMSGGPVINQYGQVVGINGGLKYPPQGIIAFIFADGTMPSESIFQQMESLSWAIPAATFQHIIKNPV